MAKKIQYSFERREKKYFITPEQQACLLSAFGSRLREDHYGKYTICNIYYDTEDWRLIRTSIEKPLYKEKLRLRSYGTPAEGDKAFLEIKKKYDGVVYKRRITIAPEEVGPFLHGCGKKDFGQIGNEIRHFQRFYSPKPRVFIGYDRRAYTGIEDPELRITFDTNLRWRRQNLDLRLGNRGSLLLPKDRILMEIKIPGVFPMWLSHFLSEQGIFATSFSKYGTCYKEHFANTPHSLSQREVHFCA